MRYLFSWAAIYIYSFFIVIVSTAPVVFPSKLFFPFQDKVVHILMYYFLSFLAVNTFFQNKIKYFKVCGLAFAFFLGLFIELGQYFIPFRSFEAGDIVANFMGSILGCLLII